MVGITRVIGNRFGFVICYDYDGGLCALVRCFYWDQRSRRMALVGSREGVSKASAEGSAGQSNT